MMNQTNEFLSDCGDGLILRRATVADAEALAVFNEVVHGTANNPDYSLGVWVRDLMLRPHPTCQPSDFTIVEEVATGKIVSSMNLISQRWSYGGISFGVGRPELVGTLPEYRNRGLVRKQFELIHQWSAERGEMVQVITGIPYYYRLFGYEMALSLNGKRIGYQSDVPRLKAGGEEPYVIREASEKDLPFIAACYQDAISRDMVACLRDEEFWRYELLGRSEGSLSVRQLCMIESAAGEAVGFLVHPANLWHHSMALTRYEVKAGVSWLAVTPSVMRYLWARGEQIAQASPKGQRLDNFAFVLGVEHPAYQAAEQRLPNVGKPYAWYMRVPDLVSFLRHVKPVLEARLAQSIAVGHSGELNISFYRDGLRLCFEKGRLIVIEPWHRQQEGAKAGFPPLTFLQLLFGYRSLEELKYAFLDCSASDDEARVLLNALFPKQASNIWPIS